MVVVEKGPRDLLSLGSASPKAMWRCRKVSSETCSQISSEITPEVANVTAHNAKGSTSRAASVTKETREAKPVARKQRDGDVPCRRSPSSLQALRVQVAGGSQQPLNRNAERRRRRRARRQQLEDTVEALYSADS